MQRVSFTAVTNRELQGSAQQKTGVSLRADTGFCFQSMAADGVTPRKPPCGDQPCVALFKRWASRDFVREATFL